MHLIIHFIILDYLSESFSHIYKIYKNGYVKYNL